MGSSGAWTTWEKTESYWKEEVGKGETELWVSMADDERCLNRAFSLRSAAEVAWPAANVSSGIILAFALTNFIALFLWWWCFVFKLLLVIVYIDLNDSTRWRGEWWRWRVGLERSHWRLRINKWAQTRGNRKYLILRSGDDKPRWHVSRGIVMSEKTRVMSWGFLAQNFLHKI